MACWRVNYCTWFKLYALVLAAVILIIYIYACIDRYGVLEHIPDELLAMPGIGDDRGPLDDSPDAVPAAADDGHLDPLFKDRHFRFYTISYHASPVADLVDLLAPLGVDIIDKGIDVYGCRFFNSCRAGKPLNVVGAEVNSFMNETRLSQFYEAYKDDEEVKSVDAFLCMHPSATCELFIAFRKPIIVYLTIRYDNGRQDARQWLAWHRNFNKIINNSNNTVAANNLYDVNFVKFYFGVEPRLLPSYCGYTRQSYSPSRPGFLLGFRRDRKFQDFFLKHFKVSAKELNSSVQLFRINELYPRYNWADLAAHRGIVNLPVQPSLMSIFEQYRMNIPLFFPSKKLMLDWEIRGHVMLNEVRSSHSEVPFGLHPPSAHANQTDVPDPTKRRNRRTAAYWNQFCDWYNLPHIVYYDSVRQLVSTLDRITMDELRRISEAMRRHNRRFKGQLLAIWRTILRRTAAISRSANLSILRAT